MSLVLLDTCDCSFFAENPVSASSTSLPVQGQLNPAQIALAAARNLGMSSALPAQAAAQALSGLGGAAGYQANPQLLAQLMKSPQNPNAGQCECRC